MNQLKNAASPYLLQHANNPVHWQMWDNSIINTAQNKNKLIIISIGYSACHWCHVMEHESFEDEEVAEVMNRFFINVKIDREERPDIDAVYMKAVQIMTGRGGWPLNVVCLPDGRPVWGGTYFKKAQWIDALNQLADLFENDLQKMVTYAEQLQAGVQQMNFVVYEEKNEEFSNETLHLLVQKWKKSFDTTYGGHARAPKFMMPTNLDFLMRYAHQFKDEEVKNHVLLTLNKMAYGGIFDTVEGGFSRYSVDLKWHIPHFEKMLYDNAQLISTYSNAYKWTKNDLFKDVVYKTIQFINEAWRFDEGGFYSALDADSLDKHGVLKEGAFYVWEIPTLKELLQEDFENFSVLFNINDFGYWESGEYVLIQSKTVADVANEIGISEQELFVKKKSWEKLLKEKRSERKLPRLDDKCIISWNAMTISGLLDAYKAFHDEAFLETAVQCAHFLRRKCWSSEGNLFHNYKNGIAYTNGFLEDYATLIQAWIHLFEVTTDEIWLEEAYGLTLYMMDHFYDEQQKMFRFNSDLDPPLMATHFDLEDNVIPASNSMVCKILQKMGLYYQNPKLTEIANQLLQKVLPQIDYPSAFSNWLDAFLNLDVSHKEIVICSEKVHSIIKGLHQNYDPNLFLVGTSKFSRIPIFRNRFMENETLFYICQNNTCHTPFRSLENFLEEVIKLN